MKVKIKTYNGELPSYLTLDKVYDVIHVIDDLYEIIEKDNDSEIVIRITCCAYLNGGSWEVVND